MKINKILWEIQRHNWLSLRSAGVSEKVPDAIIELKEAVNAVAAEKAYWKIDNVVVVQGSLYEAAVAVVPCLLNILYKCTKPARPYVLELLVQIGSGEASDVEISYNNEDILKKCLKELSYGVATYFDVLESGNIYEQEFCVDLLGLCCVYDKSLIPRYKWWLDRLYMERKLENGFRLLINNWLNEIDDTTM